MSVLEQIVWNNKFVKSDKKYCTCSIVVTQEFSKLTTSLIHSKTAFRPLTLFVRNLTQDVISYSTLALLTPSHKVGKNSLIAP